MMRDIDAAVLSGLFSESSINLYVIDRDLRVVRFNPSSRRVRDFPVGDILGKPALELLRLFDLDTPERAEQLLLEVLETGVTVLDEWFTARSRDPVVESVHSMAIFRLHDPDGAVLGAALVMSDVTERAAADARLRLLNLASTSIGTTLDVYQTAMEMCTVCVPKLADIATVDVLDSLPRGDAPESDAVQHGQLLRRAGFHSAEGEHGVPALGDGVSHPEGTPYARALASLRPVLIPHLDHGAEWLERDPRGSRIRQDGVHSMMVVPLLARGAVLGLGAFYRSHKPVPFDTTDLDLAEQIASAAALCLDNARLYTRERSVARLLGAGGARSAGESVRSAVESAHAYVPAGVGGAWFDVIALSGSRVALVVGECTGCSGHAAAAMGELRASSAALSGLDLLPDEILERLHMMVGEPDRHAQLTGSGADGPDAADEQCETMVYVVYDPATRTCSAASAGHPLPLVAFPDGRVEQLDIPQGPPLGQGEAQYTAAEHVLPEGTVLLLHNDVLLESDAGVQPDRLGRAAATGESSLQEICDMLMRRTDSRPPERDAIVLLARTRALHPDQTAAWTLPDAPDTAGRARALATAQLADWGMTELSDSTELIVSELVTNALRHAAGPIGLRLIVDRALTCEVTDESNTAPRLRRAQDTDEGGRGLFITEQLTQRWGARPNRHGKTIWAEQPLSGPAAFQDSVGTG